MLVQTPDPGMCPVKMMESVWRYYVRRVATGSFLQAVLRNDLYEAVARADLVVSLPNIHHITSFVYQMVPEHARGSAAAIRDWVGDELRDCDDERAVKRRHETFCVRLEDCGITWRPRAVGL